MEKRQNVGTKSAIVPKKNLQLVCGNAIAEIGEKNLWQFWECHC